MKQLLILLCALFIANSVNAQQCTEIFPLTNNATWEVYNYDAKGKFDSSAFYKVKSLSENNGEIIAIVTSTMKDNKGKEISTFDMEMKCTDDAFYIDMSSFLINNQSMQMPDVDIKMGGDFMELPKNLTTGTDLKDASIEAEVESGGVGFMKMSVDIYDRKVIANEKVTVPAGTFDCAVISQNSKMKMMVSIQSSSKTWYAKEVGMVRNESYNKKGKLVGYSELNKISK